MTDTVETADSTVQQVLGQLTLDEKLSMLDGLDFWHTQPAERVGVPKMMVTDGPHGLRKQTDKADHLGINASVPATCFPPAVGLGSTWDVELVEEVGQALGEECLAENVSVLLGPGLNIKRSPLCGRNFEYMSEDPLVGGEMASALVTGIQSKGVGACPKHFVANNQETWRQFVSADIDERTLREIYLRGFEIVVTKARPYSLMSSYNKVNGEYVADSRRLLTDILRDEWGFDGLVMSDWSGTGDRAVGLHAGLDLEMPSSNGQGEAIVRAALERGEITVDDVDTAVTHLLTLWQRTISALAEGQSYDKEDHHALARRAATESAVLLKNDGLLPLRTSGGPLAVIGAFAENPRYQGAGSSQVTPTKLDNALDAITELVAGGREIRYAPGFKIESDEPDPALVGEAVAAVTGAEAAVLFLGLPPLYESEGYDREHMNLPPNQLALLREIAATGVPVAVVLSNGSVVDVTWRGQARAILEGWLLGQAGGSATAELLFGKVNPSGKLAETMPLRFQDNPSYANFPGELGHVRYGEGTLVGYRWYDSLELDVAYPFGHGLSYTTFDYTDATVQILRDGADPQVEVAVTVTNTGACAGREIVQIYVSDAQASVKRAPKELKAFGSVTLEAGESKRLNFALDARAFAYFDVQFDRWYVEGGDFAVLFGASSRDIRATVGLHLEGDPEPRPLTVDSPLSDWLAHPVAGKWFLSKITGTDYESMLTDHMTGALFTPTPLSRMARFAGFPVSVEEADAELKTL
ncbi:MAG: glycoside hydrolase family 3 C-terminal domain-containing protein [Propionibacteriaceae bacterium]|jgi:beta-glucosidase|nr:glycoside hydrolase family 3 C-terminal domain-containing protein [Propionibacteriaceae bacterium]